MNGRSRYRLSWLAATLVILVVLSGVAVAAVVGTASGGWYAVGSGGAIEGGGYTLHGVANMAGASVGSSTGSSAGGNKSLYAGFVAAPGVGIAPPTTNPTMPGGDNGVFLPVVTR